MKKAIRICLTLTFAAIMAMAMGTTVFADAGIPASGDAKIVSNSTTLNIPKAIKVKSATVTDTSGATITYSFSAAPATVAAGTTVTDSQEHTATVQAGPEGGFQVTSSPAFNGENATASASGTAQYKNIVCTTDLTKFSQPGIYRYVLTDNTAATTLSNAGVVKSANYNNTRYVDVYIVRNGSSLEVSGYVVFSGTTGTGGLIKETFDTYTPINSQSGEAGTTVDTADTYTLIDLDLAVVTVGNMGDKSNLFGFSGIVNNGGKKFYTGTSAANKTAGTNGTAFNTTMKDGDHYYIYGLTPQITNGATVAWTESNTSTDAYKIKVDGASTSIAAETSVAAGSTKAITAQNATSANTAVITFTNTLDGVSPTGFALRYGTPLLLLLAGLAVVLLFRRARREDADLA